ncbi:crossover junction endodeoxyribonuclease RuvC [Afifella marina DSM 2698]|uniref:Crossover junction endodeoxyribonuclease RuvC n=1 Tax=Afifella marina DSM 2698 TaxID=1120955 RepID=A0A1G5P454_AFIMA|nr:crossover junction endodeoxyribonuclease RuvC [Afifella marina DSM 2698]MBK1628776.1 crossover junction endodeoxyribonuclease RuvC [Afifella marina]MBK5918434.1 crossover junction endodeoxyribonuclease RuvC [Afifella marina]RAI19509.1 crossover junction endodeoxyribonuclease RuvC [Afifella marina DSM 2698]SCZ44325.1 Holliday junction endonuclease RuvC [Afifella marina DSM 2698]
MKQTIRIIGIDPGLRRTGWGVVDMSGTRLAFVASGTVRSDDGGALCDRLAALYDGLVAVISKHGPGEAAVEHTFVNRDAGATLKLGQARGIALLAPAKAGLKVAEYAPNMVKKSVVGAGHAQKGQIRTMVSILMPKATFDSDDAADALAIAICHAHHRGSVVAQAETTSEAGAKSRRGGRGIEAAKGSRTANEHLSSDELMRLVRGRG